MKHASIGSSFESFLEDEGIRDETHLLAQKRVIARQIEQAMAEQGISKVEMAALMRTSRTQVDRLLDPENPRVQLDTLQRAALAVGRCLKVELADPTRSGSTTAARRSSSRYAPGKSTSRKRTGPARATRR